MQARIQRHLLESGVTIVAPTTTYIEDGVTMGRDTVLQPFTFIGRDTSIGPEWV